MKLIYGKGLLEIAGCGPLALEPMALALSRIYRWSGHSPITVAQHAVMASYLCPAYPREALLHDASEALIGDIPAPLKRAFPELQAFEADLLERIFRGFGLCWPIPPAVKGVDRRLLATEAHQFFGLDYPEPYGMEIQPWNPAESQRRFLERAEEVGLCPQREQERR